MLSFAIMIFNCEIISSLIQLKCVMCLDGAASVFNVLFSLQISFYQETGAVYHAGVALDDIEFQQCALPRPTGILERRKQAYIDHNLLLSYQNNADLNSFGVSKQEDASTWTSYVTSR